MFFEQIEHNRVIFETFTCKDIGLVEMFNVTIFSIIVNNKRMESNLNISPVGGLDFSLKNEQFSAE